MQSALDRIAANGDDSIRTAVNAIKTNQGALTNSGYGSLFNHARQPNVNYRLDKEAGVIRYYAALGRAIAPGDELCIYYGEDKELWFDMPPEEEDGECHCRRMAAGACLHLVAPAT